MRFTLKSGSCERHGHVSSVGVPSILNILLSWSSTSAPGNNGLPAFAISVKADAYKCSKSAYAKNEHHRWGRIMIKIENKFVRRLQTIRNEAAKWYKAKNPQKCIPQTTCRLMCCTVLHQIKHPVGDTIMWPPEANLRMKHSENLQFSGSLVHRSNSKSCSLFQKSKIRMVLL